MSTRFLSFGKDPKNENAPAVGNADVQSLLTALVRIAALLEQIAKNTAENGRVVLDTGALVGQLLPAIDDGLGKVAARKERGM